jgi:hypothetical protein
VVQLRGGHRLVDGDLAGGLGPLDLPGLDEQLRASGDHPGVGLAARSSGAKTFASAVFAETTDHTRPIARVGLRTRSGDDVRWTWSGYDPRLQTHLAGLAHYDVAYRNNYGGWYVLRNNTTATSLSLANRPPGSYAIRVRATDRRGNVGAWSAESRIWVP